MGYLKKHRSAVLAGLGLAVLAALIALYVWLPVAIFTEPPGSQVTKPELGTVTIETVAENLTAPWSIDFAENGDAFFTQRPGLVNIIRNGQVETGPILELPDAPSEGGTLGLALDPNFSTSRYVFIYYTTPEITNRISRFRFDGEQLVEETVLVDNIPGAAIHNGGRLGFGPDGNLYAGTGDANAPELSQDRDSLAGKILRLEPNGNIPADNPFSGSYVYSLGHRNVQGLAWDKNGNLYATEHGARALDEVNLIEPGANYGWPVVEGTIELGPEADAPVANYRNPVIDSGNVTWAPSGAAFYTGDVLPGDWRDKFLFAGLRSQGLWRLDVESQQLESLFSGQFGRLRDVKQSPDGFLYVLTSNRDGRGNPTQNDDRILRIIPSD